MFTTMYNTPIYYSMSFNIKHFSSSLIEHDQQNALKYGCNLISHGYNDDFWIVCFGIMVEYTHIFLPNGPVFLYDKYIMFTNIKKKCSKMGEKFKLKYVYYEVIVPVIEKLCNNYKQHISLYIQPQYNATNKIKHGKIIRQLFIDFNKVLNKMVKDKQKNCHKIMGQTHIIKLQTIIGKLLSVDCDSLTNFINHSHIRINIYTHTHSQVHEKIVNNIWNIVLNHAKKLNTQTYENIRCLVKLFHTRLLHRIELHCFIILNALFYFIYAYNYHIQPPPCIDETQQIQPVNEIKGNEHDEHYAHNGQQNSQHNSQQSHEQNQPHSHQQNHMANLVVEKTINNTKTAKTTNNTSDKTFSHDVYEQKFCEILNKPNNEEVQTILNEIDDDIKNDPFYMIKVYKLLQIPFDNGNEDTIKNKEVSKKLQQQMVRQSIHNFNNVYTSDHIREFSEKMSSDDYKIIDNKLGMFSESKSSQFQIIKMNDD